MTLHLASEGLPAGSNLALKSELHWKIQQGPKSSDQDTKGRDSQIEGSWACKACQIRTLGPKQALCIAMYRPIYQSTCLSSYLHLYTPVQIWNYCQYMGFVKAWHLGCGAWPFVACDDLPFLSYSPYTSTSHNKTQWVQVPL